MYFAILLLVEVVRTGAVVLSHLAGEMGCARCDVTKGQFENQQAL